MYRYIIYHKPRGEITARKDANRPTVMDAFPEDLKDLFPVGRLDKETEGLLLFTDDGALAARLLHPLHHVEKTYLFYSHGALSTEACRMLESGVVFDRKDSLRSSPAKLKVCGACPLVDVIADLSEYEKKRLRGHENDIVTIGTLTITEGKKHQVRKMLLAVGGRVIYLKRVAFGPLSL